MKSRISASIYLFHAGCRANTRITMPSTSMVTSLCCRHSLISSSFQAQGSETAIRAAHSAAIEDDAFAELGPSIAKPSAKQVKLVTEKRDPVMKNYSSRKLGSAPLSSDRRQSLKDIVATIGKTPVSNSKIGDTKKSSDAESQGSVDVKSMLPTVGLSEVSNSKIGDTKKISGAESQGSVDNKSMLPTVGLSEVPNSKIGDTKKISDAESQGSVYVKNILPTVGLSEVSNSKIGDTKKSSDAESQVSVYVKNILPTVGLSELVESVSVFGKVYSASFINASNGLRYCNIQFEDVDSSRRAVLAGKVAVGSEVFPVQPVDAVDVVAIRIKNIKKETTDHVIHSICKKAGEFVGLARTSKDVVDAFFNVRNDNNHLNILKRLNNMVIDANSWSAHVLTSKSKLSEESSAEETRYKLGLRIFDQCAELKEQLTLTRVCLEDLEVLNASIMHIEGLGANNLSGSK